MNEQIGARDFYWEEKPIDVDRCCMEFSDREEDQRIFCEFLDVFDTFRAPVENVEQKQTQMIHSTKFLSSPSSTTAFLTLLKALYRCFQILVLSPEKKEAGQRGECQSVM